MILEGFRQYNFTDDVSSYNADEDDEAQLEIVKIRVIAQKMKPEISTIRPETIQQIRPNIIARRRFFDSYEQHFAINKSNNKPLKNYGNMSNISQVKKLIAKYTSTGMIKTDRQIISNNIRKRSRTICDDSSPSGFFIPKLPRLSCLKSKAIEDLKSPRLVEAVTAGKSAQKAKRNIFDTPKENDSSDDNGNTVSSSVPTVVENNACIHRDGDDSPPIIFEWFDDSLEDLESTLHKDINSSNPWRYSSPISKGYQRADSVTEVINSINVNLTPTKSMNSFSLHLPESEFSIKYTLNSTQMTTIYSLTPKSNIEEDPSSTEHINCGNDCPQCLILASNMSPCHLMNDNISPEEEDYLWDDPEVIGDVHSSENFEEVLIKVEDIKEEKIDDPEIFHDEITTSVNEIIADLDEREALIKAEDIVNEVLNEVTSLQINKQSQNLSLNETDVTVVEIGTSLVQEDCTEKDECDVIVIQELIHHVIDQRINPDETHESASSDSFNEKKAKENVNTGIKEMEIINKETEVSSSTVDNSSIVSESSEDVIQEIQRIILNEVDNYVLKDGAINDQLENFSAYYKIDQKSFYPTDFNVFQHYVNQMQMIVNESNTEKSIPINIKQVKTSPPIAHFCIIDYQSIIHDSNEDELKNSEIEKLPLPPIIEMDENLSEADESKKISNKNNSMDTPSSTTDFFSCQDDCSTPRGQDTYTISDYDSETDCDMIYNANIVNSTPEPRSRFLQNFTNAGNTINNMVNGSLLEDEMETVCNVCLKHPNLQNYSQPLNEQQINDLGLLKNICHTCMMTLSMDSRDFIRLEREVGIHDDIQSDPLDFSPLNSPPIYEDTTLCQVVQKISLDDSPDSNSILNSVTTDN